MLPGHPQERGAEAFCENLDRCKQNPELLRSYLVERGVPPEVIDSVMTGLCGNEGLSAVTDAKGAVSIGELQQQVLNQTRHVEDLTRQVSALRRQLQMQGEVSQLATSIKDTLDKFTSAWEPRVQEMEKDLRAEIQKVETHVNSRVAHDIGELRKDLELMARTEDLRKLREEVSQTQELDNRILAVVRREAARPKIFSVKAEAPLDGIIAYLTRKFGGNVHNNGRVIVTASSIDRPHYGPQNAVDLGSDSVFCSKNSWTPSWICYDFMGRRVTPKSYSIRSHHLGPGDCHTKSWVLEVSYDGSEGSWKVVDSRENNNDLNDKHVTRNFSLGTPPSEAFRFVRLRQTGKNHWGSDSLAICALELFGALSRE